MTASATVAQTGSTTTGATTGTATATVTKKGSPFVILRKMGAGWQQQGGIVYGRDADHALKRALEQIEDKDATWLAIPARYWLPKTPNVKTTTTISLQDAK